jgi:hypothetical protein
VGGGYEGGRNRSGLQLFYNMREMINNSYISYFLSYLSFIFFYFYFYFKFLFTFLFLFNYM